MRVLRLLCAIGLVAQAACADPPAAEPPPDGPAAAQPLLDPTLFDCSSLGPDGTRLPERRSPVPASCALDPKCRTPQIQGHRGAGGMLGRIAPEDTLASYRAAIALGIAIVETYPLPTPDGLIVNMHDPEVDRTTDGKGAVDRMSFAELRALHVRAEGLPGDFICERVPTLTEVLRTCRGRVVVSVDANKTDRVDLLVQAIREADALDWAVFNTSSVDKIDRALQLEPRLHIHIRPRTLEQITAQLDHFAPRLPVLVEVGGSFPEAARLIHERGTRMLTDAFAEDISATFQGDLSGYGRLLDQGVDVIQADRPDLALALYRQRGLRP